MMTNEGALALNIETISTLPIESLAFAVLKNYAETDSWNPYNWMFRAQEVIGLGLPLYALAEAWAWLESNALVAPDPNQSSSQARFITRAGHRSLANGSSGCFVITAD